MVIFYANFDKIILSFSRLFYLRAANVAKICGIFKAVWKNLKENFKKMPLQCHAEGMTMFLDM